jgi:hypothetical protein
VSDASGEEVELDDNNTVILPRIHPRPTRRLAFDGVCGLSRGPSTDHQAVQVFGLLVRKIPPLSLRLSSRPLCWFLRPAVSEKSHFFVTTSLV